MKILLVKSLIPSLKRAGTDIVTYDLLKLLSMDHQVTFLGMGHSREEVERAAQLEDVCSEVHAILAPNKRSFVHRLYYKVLNTFRFILLLRSYEVSYNTPMAFKRMLASLTGRKRYDLVIIEYWHDASLKSWVKLGTRTMLLVHDAAFVNNYRRLLVERSRWKKAVLRPLYHLKKREELRSVARFDQVLTISSADIGHFMEADPRMKCIDFRTIPISVIEGPEDIPPDKDEVLLKNSLYFIGSLDRYNHLDALIFFLEEIYPHLGKSHVDVELYVVGSCRPSVRERIGRIAPVRFVGFIEETVKGLEPYRICIVPLRIGSGIKIKILEAFVLGKPVVTTSVGAEGIAFFDKFPSGVHDDPRGFADEIEHLLGDKDYFDQVRRSQRQYAKDHLTIRGNRESVRATIEMLANELPEVK